MISVFLWLILVPIKLVELTGIFSFVDMIRRVFIKTRMLTKEEIEQAKLVFGDSIDYRQVRISENSKMAAFGAKKVGKKHLGFVLFRTVNFSRELSHVNGANDMAWLIHELVHVLQYNTIGIQYVLLALRAQRNGGYNYGGKEGLSKAAALQSFNLEQQADIARDYYLAILSDQELNLFERFIIQMKSGNF